MQICYLGRVEYARALEIQYKLLSLRQKGQVPDVLLLLEHDPVITLGTRGQRENIYINAQQQQQLGLKIFKVSRGGDVTYHGPGQLIGYPLVRLYDRPGGIRSFVHHLEQAAIDLLADSCRIKAECRSGKMTGVWVGEKKIMALGLSVHQGVTMHGFALNINTDLSHFSWINPCGLSRGVTSLQEQTGKIYELATIAADLGERIGQGLGEAAVWIEPAQIEAQIKAVELPPMRLEELTIND